MSSQVIPSDLVNVSNALSGDNMEVKVVQVVIEFMRIGEIGTFFINTTDNPVLLEK
jgi:hypothetical protein